MPHIMSVNFELLHDIKKKRAKATVTAVIHFDNPELNLLPEHGNEYEAECWIKGSDPGTNPFLYNFTFRRQFSRANTGLVNDIVFEREIDSALLNEDAASGSRDELYANVYLHWHRLRNWKDDYSLSDAKKKSSNYLHGWFGEE